MHNVSVSIIIPLYKVEKFIIRCLKSVHQQTYPNIECLIIEDCGPDNSLSLAQNYLAENPNFNAKIIFHTENKGLSDARNTGMKVATGKYVFFLDSDDELTNNAIEILVNEAENTNADMVVGDINCINEAENWQKNLFPILYPKNIINGSTEIFRAFINNLYPGMACNKLVKRDFLIENKLFFVSGLLSQDVLWNFDCAFKLNKIALVRTVTYLYYFHKDSIIHNRGEKHFNDWIKIINAFNEKYIRENDAEIKNMIKLYILRFKTLTLQLNWKGQKNETLWKKSYNEYKKMPSMNVWDYISPHYSLQEKKENFLQNIPTSLGFKIFKKRWGA